jgi:hypothetical protein
MDPIQGRAGEDPSIAAIALPQKWCIDKFTPDLRMNDLIPRIAASRSFGMKQFAENLRRPDISDLFLTSHFSASWRHLPPA